MTSSTALREGHADPHRRPATPGTRQESHDHEHNGREFIDEAA